MILNKKTIPLYRAPDDSYIVGRLSKAPDQRDLLKASDDKTICKEWYLYRKGGYIKRKDIGGNKK